MYFVLYKEKHYSEKGSLGFTRWPKGSQGVRFLLQEGWKTVEVLSTVSWAALSGFQSHPGWGRRLWPYRGVPRPSKGVAFSDHCPGRSGGGSVPGASRALPEPPPPTHCTTSCCPLDPEEPCPLAQSPPQGMLPRSFRK